MYLKLVKVISVIFVLITPGILRAQDAYWGFKGGINIVNVSPLPVHAMLKEGFNVGIFGNFKVSEKVSFQHEILFSTKGVTLQLPDSLKQYNNGSTQYTQTFNYIDLPWMVNYHTNKVFMISGGIQPSIYAHFTNPKFSHIEENKDNVNSLDFSLLGGASVMLKNNVGFGIRFNLGLVPTFDELKGKNYTMQFFLSYAVNRR
jgi:hypothetical protein